jgi:hypothetical protein
MKNTIKHQSGVTNNVNATTLTGAKREATKQMSYGGGSVTLYFDGEIWYRNFWQQLNRFGWDRWTKIEYGEGI